MGIKIRAADLERDREAIIRFLFDNLTECSDARRFDWLYLKNPDGPAAAWLAIEERSGAIAGSAAAFPRRLRVRGQDCIGWNLGDFAIQKEHRTLGPALLLQRACLEPVEKGEVPFCYDHPSAAMCAIYDRLGVAPLGRVIRFARPLRVDRKVEKIIKVKALARPVAALLNLLLSLRLAGKPRPDAGEIAEHQGRFGPEFSELCAGAVDRYPVCGWRSAEYLNWHYLDHPFVRFRTLTSRKGGRLRAYLIYSVEGPLATLADLFGEDDDAAAAGLLHAAVRLLRREGAGTFSAPVLESNPLVHQLLEAGFLPRESAPALVYTRPEGPLDGLVNRKENWFLIHGDRDL